MLSCNLFYLFKMGEDIVELKQENNLFNALFYGADPADVITKALFGKIKKSGYENLEDNKEKLITMKKSEKIYAPLYTPFIEQRKNIDRFSTLYSFEGPFEILHVEHSRH